MLDSVVEIVIQASRKLHSICAKDSIRVDKKLDNSPVTNADITINNFLVQELQKLYPDIPAIAEESVNPPYPKRSNWNTFWLLDPIDGTKAFISGLDEFTINVALIKNNKPIIGVVSVPAKYAIYYADSDTNTAYKLQFSTTGVGKAHIIQAKPTLENTITIATSRHHNKTTDLQAFLEPITNYSIIHCSSSLKICLIATGEVDLYPRFSATSHWDTAAAQCILENANGYICDFAGTPLTYQQKPDFINPPFIATTNCIKQQAISWCSRYLKNCG